MVRSYLNGLAVFSTFFNFCLNLVIRSSWSEPQSAPGLVFADCIELLHLWLLPLLSNFSHVRLCVTPQAAAHQAPLSLGFSRQEHWRGLPFPTKNVINLISVLTIWRCPCVESSLVLLEEGVCYDQCTLVAKLYYPLLCFILYTKAKFACYSRCFSYFCIPVPYNEKDIFFGLVLKDLVGLHRTFQL